MTLANVGILAKRTSLLIVVDDFVVNYQLSSINSWSIAWLVSFHPSKTGSIIFSRKCSKTQLYLGNGNPIPQVNTHKHLGFTFAEDGKWTSHTSASIDITTYWHLRSRFISHLHLERMHILFIRLLLEYADSVGGKLFKWSQKQRRIRSTWSGYNYYQIL